MAKIKGKLAINRALLGKLEAMGRNDLKALHAALRGRPCFGRKEAIVRNTAAAVREYLGMDD